MGMVNSAITQGKFWVCYTGLSHKANSGYGKQGYHTRQILGMVYRAITQGLGMVNRAVTQGNLWVW